MRGHHRYILNCTVTVHFPIRKSKNIVVSEGWSRKARLRTWNLPKRWYRYCSSSALQDPDLRSPSTPVSACPQAQSGTPAVVGMVYKHRVRSQWPTTNDDNWATHRIHHSCPHTSLRVYLSLGFGVNIPLNRSSAVSPIRHHGCSLNIDPFT